MGQNIENPLPTSFLLPFQDDFPGTVESQLKKCSGERPAMDATAAKKAVWSLMDDDEDADVELVNPDTLIDEEDLKKPDAGSHQIYQCRNHDVTREVLGQ